MIREVGPVQFGFVIPTERRNLSLKFVIPTEGEIEGLDLHEHGFPAYPEYVVTGDDGCPKSIDDVPIGRRTGWKLPKIDMKKAS